MSEKPEVDGPEAAEIDEIRLTLPALPAYARIARLTVTGLAARVGYSYDEIEDLRIAVGEICNILLPGTEGRLVFRIALAAEGLTVEAVHVPPGPPPAVTELSHQILEAVVDDVEITPERALVRVVKRREAPRATA